MLTRALWLSILMAVGGSSLAAAAPAGGYAVIKKIPIPGEGSWDYLAVDEGARRLYVSHGTQVEVIDVDSESVVGNVPKTPGVHGIAVAAEQGRGFVSNGQSSTVTIFDLKTLKPIAEVATGKNRMPLFSIRQRREYLHSMAAAIARRRSMLRAARWPGRWIWAADRNLRWRMEKGSSTTIWKMKVWCLRLIRAI
jgi:hypothetical protein